MKRSMRPSRSFHGAWFACIFAMLAFPSCQSCGEVSLAGDSAEADPPVSICGNGLIEPGEECDGGRRTCEGASGCGSGAQECSSNCRWGDCVAPVFEIIAGPILASSDYVINGLTGNLLWKDDRFNAFYLCREDQTDLRDSGCRSIVDEDGGLIEPPDIFAPCSLFDADLWDVTIAHAYGRFPFAVILHTISTNDIDVLNFIDSEGLLVYEVGIPIHEEYINGSLLYSRADGFIAYATRWADFGGGFITLDSGGGFTGMYIPPCPHVTAMEGLYYRTPAVSTEEGYTALFNCIENDDLPRNYSLSMIRLDPLGNPQGDPIAILEDQDVFFDGVGAAYTGSLYGIVYHGFNYEDDSDIVDLKMALLDDSGHVIHGPSVIGKIYQEFGFGNGNSAIAWTGSEIGVAFAEPLSEPYGEDFRTMVKFVRLDGEGSFIGGPLEIYGESYSHTVRVAWNGSRYGVTWNEPFFPSGDSRLHFALLGCADQD
jgi:hypothetical protein